MMLASSSARNCYFYVLTCYVVGTVLVADQVLSVATSCLQLYPSDLAYDTNSVYKSEWVSANCRQYPTSHSQARSEVYIHCDGAQLRLSDSYYGSEQYTSSEYYVWPAGSSNKQLLFTFPTRVNLTTITLHYYSDSVRGLARLRFWTVPDNFDAWDSPTAQNYHVTVASEPPSNRESAGHRNISIDFRVNTAKILMHILPWSSLSFSLSEVEFFQQCDGTSTSSTTEPYSPTSTTSPLTPTTAPVTAETTHTTLPLMSTSPDWLNYTPTNDVTKSSDPTSCGHVSAMIGLRETIAWALVLALTLLLIVSISVNVIHCQVGLYKLRRSKEGGAVLATKYEMDDASPR